MLNVILVIIASMKASEGTALSLSVRDAFTQEAAQRFHILDVFAQFFALRRFEHFRNFRETSIAHDEAKRFQSDLPFADVLVPIDARTARGFRVVQMKRGEPIEADDAIEIRETFSSSQLRSLDRNRRRKHARYRGKRRAVPARARSR